MTNVEQQINELRNKFCESPDGLRLAYLMYEIDGFENVKKDRYDYAMEIFEERMQAILDNGGILPEGEAGAFPDLHDELQGFRRLMDAAMYDASRKPYEYNNGEPVDVVEREDVCGGLGFNND
jgi:hypothetical protein